MITQCAGTAISWAIASLFLSSEVRVARRESMGLELSYLLGFTSLPWIGAVLVVASWHSKRSPSSWALLLAAVAATVFVFSGASIAIARWLAAL